MLVSHAIILYFFYDTTEPIMTSGVQGRPGWQWEVLQTPDSLPGRAGRRPGGRQAPAAPSVIKLPIEVFKWFPGQSVGF